MCFRAGEETELPEPEAELDDPPESNYEILAPGAGVDVAGISEAV